MGLGEESVEHAMTTWPGRVVAVRYAGDNDALTGTIASAFCAGIDAARMVTEEGIYSGAAGSVRYKTADEPTGWAAGINGQAIEIQYSGGSWIRLRVRGHRECEGATRLDVAAEYEAT